MRPIRMSPSIQSTTIWDTPRLQINIGHLLGDISKQRISISPIRAYKIAVVYDDVARQYQMEYYEKIRYNQIPGVDGQTPRLKISIRLSECYEIDLIQLLNGEVDDVLFDPNGDDSTENWRNDVEYTIHLLENIGKINRFVRSNGRVKTVYIKKDLATGNTEMTIESS